jgi:hypothetical protein
VPRRQRDQRYLINRFVHLVSSPLRMLVVFPEVAPASFFSASVSIFAKPEIQPRSFLSAIFLFVVSREFYLRLPANFFVP